MDPFHSIGDNQVYAFCKLTQESRLQDIFENKGHSPKSFEDRLNEDFLNVQFSTEPIRQPLPSFCDGPTMDDSLPEDHSTDLSVEGEVPFTPDMAKSPGFSDIKELLDSFDEKQQKTVSPPPSTCHDSDEEAASHWFASTKKRKDVILKTVLRRCRKFFQSELSSLTGFVCSKKEKVNDPLVPALRQLLNELPPAHANMDLLFFLGCLVYPQDAKRNVSKFLEGTSPDEREAKKEEYLFLIDKIHNVLYKYSHEKLESFCKIPALAHLFNFYFSQSQDKLDGQYKEGYDYVHCQCSKTLRKFNASL